MAEKGKILCLDSALQSQLFRLRPQQLILPLLSPLPGLMFGSLFRWLRDEDENGALYVNEDSIGRLARLLLQAGDWDRIATANETNYPEAAGWARRNAAHLREWYNLEKRNEDLLDRQKLFYVSGAHFISPSQIIEVARGIEEDKVDLLRIDQQLLQESMTIMVPNLLNRVPVIPIERGPTDDPDLVKTIKESRDHWTARLIEIDEGKAYMQEVLDAGLVTDAAKALIQELMISIEAEKDYYYNHAKNEIDRDEAYQLSNGTS